MTFYGAVKISCLIPHEPGLSLYSKSLPGGQSLVMWEGECPVEHPEDVFDENILQTGMIYLIIPKRRYYTEDEITQLELIG